MQAPNQAQQQKNTKTVLRVSFEDDFRSCRWKKSTRVLIQKANDLVFASKSGQKLATFEPKDKPDIEFQGPPNTHARDLRSFKFDTVLRPGATQDDLFEQVGRPALQDILRNGRDVLILSTGARGTGKSYTIFGNEKEKWGLFPKILKELFNQNNTSGVTDLKVEFQASQAYSKKICDLQKPANQQVSLQLVTSPLDERVQIGGLKSTKIETYEQGLAAFKEALRNRLGRTPVPTVKTGNSNVVIDLHLSYNRAQEPNRKFNKPNYYHRGSEDSQIRRSRWKI